MHRSHEVKQDNVLNEMVRQIRSRQARTLNPSRFSDWSWCVDGFGETMDWLLNHPRNIRKGTYLTRSPDKEVWRCALPKGLGSYSIIYKAFDYSNESIIRKLGLSNAFHETVNTYALKEIGIPISDVLACGEHRHAGILYNAYIIARNADNTYDGNALMPTGVFGDNSALRLQFARKAVEYLAIAHRCGCFHGSYNAHKILFDLYVGSDNMEVLWADVSTCRFLPQNAMHTLIPKDLVALIVDLRLSTKEIKELCEFYLKFNQTCVYTPETLWTALTNC